MCSVSLYWNGLHRMDLADTISGITYEDRMVGLGKRFANRFLRGFLPDFSGEQHQEYPPRVNGNSAYGWCEPLC
jgi:hypothetical protein